MRRKALTSLLIAVAAMAVLSAQQPSNPPAQESAARREARALVAQAESAGRDFPKALALLRQAIATDPELIAVHERLISTTRQAARVLAEDAKASTPDAVDKALAELKAEYARWVEKWPSSAVLAWAQGELNDENWTAAEQHYLRAVALDPAFARAYQKLALIADFRGENQKQIDYLKKAADVDPADPQYFFYYASAVKSLDMTRSIVLLQEVADRYPRTERGAQGLYWAAFETRDPDKKMAIYERLRQEFPPEKFSWSESGMSGLFEAYSRMSPEKAVALAADLAQRLTSATVQKTWRDFGAFGRATSDARSLIASGRSGEAIAQLSAVTRPRYVDTSAIDLLLAQAHDAAGQTTKAYALLLAVAAKTPTDGIHAAIATYGDKLGKGAVDIDADLWKQLESNAKPAPSFTLPDYPDGKPVRLEDYRGKVVLVNFWYPSCGPCRGEFPTMQRVLDKYQPRGFVILALNVYPQEDAFVLPYLRNNNFTFRPLKTDTTWAEATYGARGYPTNVLIDTAGRIMYRPGVIRGEHEQRTFELQVERLLGPDPARRKAGQTP